ncbi:PREDICTED: cytochrome P450 76C4-like [Camelina sativa]|uniref:Cytochrome P450 76C4-like n=1 Tax=Camelina sativa TaxID=90675 RepID=A0ABM0ZNB5_CAMSA|nr:PREDICTED: cytochrome P450 76C4-like [Camelina sativa]
MWDFTSRKSDTSSLVSLRNPQMEIISENVMFLLFCFLSSCFLIFTATTRFRRSSYRSATLPPGPPRLPIIGNIHQVGTNPHRSFADLSKTYGPFMSLKLGRLNSVIIASPEAAREVLKTHDQFLSPRKSTNSIRAVNHQEVSVAWLPSSSARLRLLRKLSVSLMFSPQRIEASKALRMKKVQELVNFVGESSEREEAVDISRASFTTVLNILSNLLFSVDLGSYDCKNSNKFQETVISVMVIVGKPDVANFFPFLGFLDLQSNRKAIKCCTERLLGVFRGFMDAKIALRNESTDASNIDFLDSLLALTQGDKVELDNHDIEHLLLDMFTAGTHTNSGTVEWAMAELLKNPKTMVKAQAEIDRVIGQNDVVEESDISELLYLQAAVKETFRLHPAVPLLFSQCLYWRLHKTK